MIMTPLNLRYLQRRIKKLTRSVTSASTVTPAPNQEDVVDVSALAVNLTVANPSGTPTDGQQFVLRVKQNAAGNHTITWGTAYAFSSDVLAADLPTAGNSWFEVTFRYHAGTGKWRAVEQARSVNPAPTLVSATIPVAGTTLVLVFSEPVISGVGGFATFTAYLSGPAVTATYSSGAGTNTITMGLSRTVTSTETGVLGYSPSGNAVTDLSGNELATITAATLVNSSTQVDSTPPTLTSATIGTLGTELVLVFSEVVTAGNDGYATFTPTMTGGAVTATYTSGGDSKTLVFTLSRPVLAGETGTLAYTAAGAAAIADLAENALATIASAAVTNNSTAE